MGGLCESSTIEVPLPIEPDLRSRPLTYRGRTTIAWSGDALQQGRMPLVERTVAPSAQHERLGSRHLFLSTRACGQFIRRPEVTCRLRSPFAAQAITESQRKDIGYRKATPVSCSFSPIPMSKRQLPARALLIQSPFIERILAGTKTWEIRGRATSVRGRIGLIRSKSGQVVGSCHLVDVIGPLTRAELRSNARKAGCRPSDIQTLPYPTTYAWVLRDARPFARPVPYRHPSGAVVWVRLTAATLRGRR
jgi:hypothetical protein